MKEARREKCFSNRRDFIVIHRRFCNASNVWLIIKTRRLINQKGFAKAKTCTNRAFSLWRHFTTTTRIILVFVFLLSTGITKLEFEKENEMNSGSCCKMTPS